MTPPDDKAPLVYAVRIAPATASGMQAEVRRLTADAGASFADTWEHGLLSVIATLATFPERCAVAAENDLFLGGTLRLLLYRAGRCGPAWRILFSVQEANENDPPTVQLHLIRHGSQAPLTEWPKEENDS